jgi:TolA-binding protein
VFQNKFKEAFVKLDSILLVYPQHSLVDDVYYLKAKIYKQKKEYDKAIEMYNLVIDKFPDDIRADNSLYELADMYENQLSNKDKAKELYEKLYTKYSNSVFATDARKKFRVLRGDKIVQ